MSKTKEPKHTDPEETSPFDISESSEIPEETEKIDPIDQLSTDLKESQEKYLRLYSDFDNFRKRSQKERLELILSASESVILSLLPILDDFDRALPEISDETTKSGVELIVTKLKTSLENQGLKTMETIGTPFDPELHEAVAQTPVNDKEKGKIIDEIQRGYYLNDKVIRHAKVIVGN
jgi:molecular chaperone GrpE